MIDDKYSVDDAVSSFINKNENGGLQNSFGNNDGCVLPVNSNFRPLYDKEIYHAMIESDFSKGISLPLKIEDHDTKSTKSTFNEIMDSLVEPDKKYKYLFESNPCPMFVWDVKTLQIIDCNKEALLKYGYGREEFLCLTIRDLQFVDDLLLLEFVATDETEEGLIHKQTWRQVNKRGDIMFMEISGHLINYNGRKVSFIQVNDLTEKEHTLAQFKESQAKLKTATKIARLGYWQLRADGTERYWSDEVYEIWGVTRDTFEVNFDSFLNTIHAIDREAFAAEQAAFHSWKKTFDLEYRIILPDGSIRWVYEKGNLLEDEYGNPVIFQGMVQDITPQRLLTLSLEESNKRYEYVTKASFDAIWDWDLLTGTFYRGEGFKHIFGYDPEQMDNNVGSWKKHLHLDDQHRVITGINSFIAGDGEIWQDEYRYMKADGTYAYVADKGFVIRDKDGKGTRIVGAMQDISKRKKDEEALKSFADDLYKRNKELHEFGYIVSHNLRSPVANIMGITMLLELDKTDPETIDKCINDLKYSIHRLDDVIRDLSKILSITDGSAGWTKENIDVTTILGNVSTDLKEAIVHSNAIVDMPSASYILNSNKSYLYSVLFNLIGNAIKYRSEKDPDIKVTIDQSAESTTIKISDNGIGIDLEKHGNDLFKPYKRFSKHLEGKGLGLFLVKSHVEALNGTISIESKPGKGTTFTIVFAVG